MAKQLPKTIDETKPLLEPVVYKGEKGEIKLTFYATYFEEVATYQSALQLARGIPQNLDNITPGDPVLEHFMSLPENAILPGDTKAIKEQKFGKAWDDTQAFYQEMIEKCRVDASMLALFSDNEFTFEPEPYPQRRTRKLPGIQEKPEIVFNLSIPVERHLKQCLDVLASTPDGFSNLNKQLHVFMMMFVEDQKK